jgi:hypothetical protein
MSAPPWPTLDPAAEAIMRHSIGGAIRTQAIYVAAKLGLADRLVFGPQSARQLAEQVHVDVAMLTRLLRFLVTHGVFVENEAGRFALNTAAELLQTAHPRSLRPSAIRAGEDLFAVAGGLLAGVRSGVTPREQASRSPFFQDLAARGKSEEFAARMSSSSLGLGAAIAEQADFAQTSIVIDVGGGSGSVLIPILQRHLHLRAVVFDAATAAAVTTIARAGMQERCAVVTGDFFKDELPHADVYLLSWILHDWDDAHALQILCNCRTAGGNRARVLISELLLPPRAVALRAPPSDLLTDPFTLDLQMLLLTGGRERTLAEYRELLAAADYVIETVSELPSARGASLIEARSDS